MAVERYADHFAETNVPDQEWIAFAARKRWVAVSHDRNIKSDPIAIRTVMEEGLRLFIVRGKHLTGPDKAQLFIDAQPAVHRELARHAEAFIATVHRATVQGGSFKANVRVSLTLREWRRGQVTFPPDDDPVL